MANSPTKLALQEPKHRQREALSMSPNARRRRQSGNSTDNQPELSFFDQGVIKGSSGYNRLSYRKNMTVLDLLPGQNAQQVARQTYRRIIITGPAKTEDETLEAGSQLEQALELREKYMRKNALMYDSLQTKNKLKAQKEEPKFTVPSLKECKYPEPSKHKFKMVQGVMQVWTEKDEKSKAEFAVVPLNEYIQDLKDVMEIISFGPCKTYCYNRLRILEARFQLHLLLNDHLELMQQKENRHRDFYNVRKIDNHVHHSACMNQKHLLRFIKHTVKKHPDDIVTAKDGKERTLKQVFEDMKLKTYDLSIDILNMRAEKTFHRFDKFNTKYNPLGQPLLREIFLKQNNHIKGKYLAGLTRQVIDDLESNKYQHAEYRISIYGRKPDEWEALAAWLVDNALWSKNVCWMIQVPRLYKLWRKLGFIQSFQEMLDNIFKPLFAATIDPAGNKKVALVLENIVAFDSVDDESQREQQFYEMPQADKWTVESNPPYSLWSYYMYANIAVLNKLRLSKGMNTFTYRPHAGEAGDIEHLAATFLVANSINHGIQLYHSPVLQYLYYLAQIGISISPLSNNLLFCKYEDNPFPRFFRRGLNVTLSTDDPLMIHVTKEPLVEEYSVAAQVWKLSSTDLCEIARNSVLQSDYAPKYKAYWVGHHYWKQGPEGNDVKRTNVPDIRVGYRWEILQEEIANVRRAADARAANVMAAENKSIAAKQATKG